ncbi:MAG: DUF3667 domain-containing protein [Xanthomonadales bacterium]|nr:DUF3667 domain-containing protein [Gammaproteobacteria bacterium]MBT8052499.1 DUF3667 domain-containing protein [Gammaproteobacteria bacterium]NND57127.1 DUF3667 domain-containing protein [Xanthomonadales bacterium]NNK52777.1 DUF3667 domain-containing protein [Xanthomonadales bacterium]
MNADKSYLPVQQPGKSLTIAANRLAGSPDCLNCGTDLKGPFCYFCGQPDKNLMRFFPALMRELLEDTLDFDSRFLRTLKPLLFKPGKLTRDYLDGRRFRYVPPLRLYIFSSIAFFFLAAMLTNASLKIGDSNSGDVVTGVQLEEKQQQKIDDALDRLDPATAEEARKTIREAQQEQEQEGEHEHDTININGEPWDRETNPFIVPLMPNWVNDWVNDEIGESPQKGRQIEKNPDLIMDKIFDVLPATMFVLLPLVALLFKFWYLFAKKYYVEHLIFALHNHAFVFVILLITISANSYASWLDPTEEGLVASIVNFMDFLVLIWIPLYMFLSLKRVYGQGWGLTFLKFSCIGISYMMLLALATSFVALLSFVLL